MRVWKIADFGITQEGTARTPLVTTSRRGTVGYRAPELLSSSAIYTNKVDVWAFGCIVYEVLIGQKRFASDWEAETRAPSSEPISNLVPRDSKLSNSIGDLITATLNPDWRERPTCAKNHETLLTIGTMLIKSTAVSKQIPICRSCLGEWNQWVCSFW